MTTIVKQQPFTDVSVEKNTTVSIEKTVEFSNVFISANVLYADQITKLWETIRRKTKNTKQYPKIIRREEISSDTIHLTFPLREGNAIEISKLRGTNISILIVKIEQRLFYTPIPRHMTFLSINFFDDSIYSNRFNVTSCKHKCASQTAGCLRLSAANDENGGCEKIRNGSSGIEKYPWIRLGFETFNTVSDCFVVSVCDNCTPYNHLNK